MKNISRKNFLLICGAGIVGLIGGVTIANNNAPKEKYTANIQVNPNEFLSLENKQNGHFYIALGGYGITQDEEADFIEELLNQNIVPYDACDIHNLPKANETISNTFPNLTITTKDELNYTISSEDKSLIDSLQKHQSEILAHNNKLFSGIKTR